MAERVFDVIVVGAGIEGSASAYTSAKRGRTTLLLEQFILPHTRGSSHGATRIIRKAYNYEVYVKMMIEAYQLWNNLEKETDTELYKETGLMVIDKKPYPFIKELIETFQKFNLPYTQFSHEELTKQYPMLRVPQDCKGCLDIGGGTLKADKAIISYQTMFKKLGGLLHDGEQVTRIIPGEIVTVETSKGVYKTHSLIVTSGAWTGPLLQSIGLKIPLKVVSINVCYWKVKDGQTSFPHGFIAHNTVPWPDTFLGSQITDVYGLPASEYSNCMKVVVINVCFWKIKPDEDSFPHCFKMTDTGVCVSGLNGGKPLGAYGLCSDEYPGCTKVCLHNGYEADPDRRDVDRETGDIKKLSQVVQQYFPTLEDTPCIVERCMYTYTPDHNPVLDRHPQWKNILIGAGFSGHGFKLAPIVGKVLTEMALDERPSYDLSMFKVGRFQPKASL